MRVRFAKHCTRHRLAASAAIFVVAATTSLTTLMSPSSAQEDPAAEPATGAESPKAAPKFHKPRHVVRKKTVAQTTPAPAPVATQTAAAPPAAVTSPAASPPAARPFDFAAQLDKAGASTCQAQVNALAASTMGDVVKFNTVSNWAPDAGGKRAVSVAIGQKYADGSKVPFGVSQIVTAPNQQGGCDGLVTQVLPSPLSCSKLKDSITARGKQIGDLAGIPLLQDANGRVMLIPTGADACVLVTSRSVYVR